MTLTDWLLIGLMIAAVASLIVNWNFTLESRSNSIRSWENCERCEVIHSFILETVKPDTSNIDAFIDDLRRHPKPADAEIYREGSV